VASVASTPKQSGAVSHHALYLTSLVFSHMVSHECGSDRVALGGMPPRALRGRDRPRPRFGLRLSLVAGSVRVFCRETRTVARAAFIASSHCKEESNHVVVPRLRWNGYRQATLDLHALSTSPQSRQFANSPAGHRALLRWLQGLGSVHVVCEASGGYERAVVLACSKRPLPSVSSIRARPVTLPGRKVGWPDRSAGCTSAGGVRSAPAASGTPVSSAASANWPSWCRAVSKCSSCAARAQPSGAHHASGRASPGAASCDRSGSAAGTTRRLDHGIGSSRAIAGAEDGATLCGGGRGRITAAVLLATMPELGALNRRQAAALVGWPRSIAIAALVVVTG